MKKLKLLFILPTLSKGGQERVASRLSFALPDEFEKKLIVFYKYRVDYEFNGEILSLNLPLPPSSFLKIFRKALLFFKKNFFGEKN